MIGIGEVLFGRYRVDALLRAGDGVDVWQGVDLHACAPVQVKVWGEGHDAGPALLEGEAMAAVQHPGVVRLVDFGLHEGHQPCLMIESAPGETLAERLQRVGTLPWAAAFELGAQVLEGLAALHDEGLVHGDVSSESIVLLSDRSHGSRRVKLVGLQHVTLAGLCEGRLTDEPPPGRLEYKAPEQLAGAGVRPSTDLYALGLVLWEAICGVRPFAAEPESLPARLGWRPEIEQLPAGAPVLPVAAKLALDRMVRPSLAYREADARLCSRRLRAVLSGAAPRFTQEWALAAS
jgi:eukaryotic-like serine/threonine-protein kinase